MSDQVNLPPPEHRPIAPLLEEAERREKEYDWLGAAEQYGKLLSQVPEEDGLRKGDSSERTAYALHRAAMQAESKQEFRERMSKALDCYQRAREFYTGLNAPTETGRSLRCSAMIHYLGFWLASEAPEKKRLTDESWTLAKEALKTFEQASEALEYGRTYNQLSLEPSLRYCLAADFQARQTILREAVELGEQAITFLYAVQQPGELARAHLFTGDYLRARGMLEYFLSPDEADGHSLKADRYWKKARELCQEINPLESLLPLSGRIWFIVTREDTIQSADEFTETDYQRLVEYGLQTKDKLVLGSALNWLAYHMSWRGTSIEDPDEKLEFAKKALAYAEEAGNLYHSICFTSPFAGTLWVGAPHAEHCLELALLETDLIKKQDLLETALKLAPGLLRQAEESGYPEVIGSAYHVFSKILAAQAKIEASLEKKRRLLEKAREHRNKSLRSSEQLGPYHYWNLGLEFNYLADIETQLADLARDPEGRVNLVQEAVRDKEMSLNHWLKWTESATTPVWEFAVLGESQYDYGNLLNHLYELTNNKEHLKKAALTYQQGAESFHKRNLVSRMAECDWNSAQAYDVLGDHLKSAENFASASENYRAAGEKIPQLRAFYEDHASYMQAWSEIEKGRHHHGREEYGEARESYEKAASLHKSTKRWSYLAPNYSAWALLEKGESLSRKEHAEEAIHAFEEAVKLFEEAKKTLQTELEKIESTDLRHIVRTLTNAADLRRDYCRARIAMEEARVLDRKGEDYSSSEKYRKVVEILDRTLQSVDSEEDRRELRLIITLSKAWQMATKAEAEVSPELYLEASRLFEAAKELSPTKRSKMLAQGHSRFCRALEAGARFVDTGDMNLHSSATQHLERAADSYLKAGFQTASEYANASKLLFDAYAYMENARRQEDPGKKANLYAMTERVLQTSSESYAKAEQQGKKEQVQRLLEAVRNERKLAVSLTEVLQAPPIVSTTAAFLTPTATHEEAVGLERFEHADIQANIITRQTSLKVGEDLDLEIELANAGRGSAQLVKVEAIIPEGFELREKPEPYRVEGSYLNMKGKRLDSLKTEEVKLVLKSKAKGQFTLSPRILYLDESGKYKTSEPEPVEITVRELGLSGWVKGR